MAAEANVLRELLRRHGQTFAEEAGIGVDDSADAAFRALVLSLLLSARIRAAVAVRATAGLMGAGWGDPRSLAESSWQERVDVLDRAGYSRYDERTARQLGECADMVLDEYAGDLRVLRDRAGSRPAAERRLLQRFPGIGPLGATIFAREIQGAWPEWYPFADERALASARLVGLPSDAGQLAQMVAEPAAFVRLVAALVRSSLAKDHAAIRAQAGLSEDESGEGSGD